MTDLEMWTLLVGALLPALIAVIQQPQWSCRLRAVVTVVACLVAGGGTAGLDGQLTGRSVVTSVLTVLVTALATYHGFWKPSGIAAAVEGLTSSADVTPPA